MIKNKTTSGSDFETKTCLYLTQNNYSIVDRNFRMPFGEIDIIAKDGQTKELVFIEVKGMTVGPNVDRNDMIKPEDNFTPAKIQKLKKIIMAYLSTKSPAGMKYYDAPWRIDLIAIESTPTGTVTSLNHYKNIYIPFG